VYERPYTLHYTQTQKRVHAWAKRRKQKGRTTQETRCVKNTPYMYFHTQTYSHNSQHTCTHTRFDMQIWWHCLPSTWMCTHMYPLSHTHTYTHTRACTGIAVLVRGARRCSRVRVLDVSFNWVGPRVMQTCLQGVCVCVYVWENVCVNVCWTCPSIGSAQG
jgi:hypothetical protein